MPALKDTAVKVSGGPIGHKVAVTINDMIIPVYSADIHIEPGELITMNITVRAEHIDIEALQQSTHITVKETE